MMMSVEKKMGRATSVVRLMIESSVNISSGWRSRFFKMVSIMTMAPSTIMPKSMAPNDSKLAGISVTCIRRKAMRSANGIVNATNSAPRQLLRNKMSTSTTSIIPSNRVCDTV